MQNTNANKTKTQANKARAKRRAKVDPKGNSQKAAIARKREADRRSAEAKIMRANGHAVTQIMRFLDAGRTTVHDLLRRPDNSLVSDHFPNLLRKTHVFTEFSDLFNEPMFPREAFKQTYDKIRECAAEEAKASGGTRAHYEFGDTRAGYEYLQILRLAVIAQQENAVEQVLKQLLESGCRFGYGDVIHAIPPVPGDDN